MFDRSDRSFRLLSYTDDLPNENRGLLIPSPKKGKSTSRRSATHGAVSPGVWPVVGTIAGAFAVLVLTVVATAGYGLVASNNLASAPTVTIVDTLGAGKTSLGYGPSTALSANSFFVETRDAFIDEGQTFIEVDVSAKQVRYFKRGVLLQSAEIFATGERGSWWAAPSGLYQVERLEERPFSNLAQLYLPYSVRFGGNYVIHGWPEYPNGEVATTEEAGGIRLSSEAAAALYRAAHENMPVLVHTPVVPPDTFIYEPIAEDITAPHYLVADAENGTILASSDFEAEAPIASLTKLMTAVVAAEEIDLDDRVQVSSPSFITSLIPRLAERTSVSVYSLMQLLLVESSNEAAEVIASQIGREAFLEKMNEKARQLGMLHTTFTDPSGLDDGNHSSVSDLYKLMRYIHTHRSFIFEITNRTRVSTEYEGNEFEDLVNFNQIESLNNFVGGKVGETNAAGQTSATLHKISVQGEERVIMVILLGSEARAEDVRALLRHVSANYRSQ